MKLNVNKNGYDFHTEYRSLLGPTYCCCHGDGLVVFLLSHDSNKIISMTIQPHLFIKEGHEMWLKALGKTIELKLVLRFFLSNCCV